MSPVISVDTVMVDGAFTCHYATCLPLHAVFAAEARIRSMSKHPLPRQGTPRHRWRVALLGLSLPLALVSTSQVTSAPSNESPVPVLVDTTSERQTVAVSSAASQAVASPATSVEALPLARDFDVREFEALAQALVRDQRVPGLAMAIVHDGKVLSSEGYGITDTGAAEPVGAHTVFRLASLSKGFAGTITGLTAEVGSSVNSGAVICEIKD